jgi:hypothetical protein
MRGSPQGERVTLLQQRRHSSQAARRIFQVKIDKLYDQVWLTIYLGSLKAREHCHINRIIHAIGHAFARNNLVLSA